MTRNSKPDPRYVDPSEEYDELPATEKFDWKSVKILCIEGIPKHRAYGMLFEEYARQREIVSDRDTTERKRLSFYLPLFSAMMNDEYAVLYKTSVHRCMILFLELGLIHFQHDYFEKYASVRRYHGKSMLERVNSEDTAQLFQMIERHKIKIQSCNGARQGDSKHFTPFVPEWLYSAIQDSSRYLGMTVSDFTYLCWVVGISRSISQKDQNVILKKRCDELLSKFDFEFTYYYKNMETTISYISAVNI
jgi:hypothetical protein